MTAPFEEDVNPYAGAPITGGSGGWGWETSSMRDTTRVQKPRNNKPGQGFSPFYMNGPSAVPFNHHQTQENLIMAKVEELSSAQAKPVLERWARLKATYGHTNSPGVLWSLAQIGLDPKAEAVQSVLQADAKAFNADYNSMMPAAPESPNAAIEPQSWFDNIWPDNFWAIPQFAARNVFAAMSMPMEALQGYERNLGNAIFGEGMDLGERAKLAGANLLSVSPFLAPFVDGGMMNDDDFQNPWEQTDFGQALLNAAGGAGIDAFTKNMAGTDDEAARELLETDPRYAEQRKAVLADPSLLPSTLQDIAQQEGLYSSPGWFVDETSIVGEAQRGSTFDAWAIPGPEGLTAWTLGRGITSAVAGPDFAAYGVMSGIIDFANALVDPTIFGAKFGVTSKTLRGAGMLLEKGGVTGAERALTVGKEARKVRRQIGVTNRNSDVMLDEYNRLAGKTWNENDKVTPQEWAAMGVDDQIEVVRQMKKMQATEEARRGLAPKVRAVRDQMRELRRARSSRDRANDVIFDVEETTASYGRQASLWEEFLQAAYLVPVKPKTKASPPVAAYPTANLSAEDADILARFNSGTGIEIYGMKIGYTREEWDALEGSAQFSILQKQNGYKQGIWPPAPKARQTVPVTPPAAAPEPMVWDVDEFGVRSSGDWAIERDGRKYILHGPDGSQDSFRTVKAAQEAAQERVAAAATPTVAAEPRVLTIEGEGNSWDVMWNGQSIGQSTSKKGAQAMRRRILKQDEADAQFDEALAAGRTPAVEEAVEEAPATEMVYSLAKVKAWIKSLSPEDRAEWNALTAYLDELKAQGKFTDEVVGGSAEDLAQNEAVKALLKKRAAKAKPGKRGRYAKNANADAAELVMLNNYSYPGDVLNGIDYAGATMLSVPDRAGFVQRAIHDGEDVITYWTRDEAPVTVGKLDVADKAIVDEVRDRVLTILDEEAALHPAYSPSGKVLPDSVGEALAELRDARGYVREALSQPEVEWGYLLNTLARLGLEGYLDDIMRKNGIDGIEGVVGRNREGVWFGDHPALESYHMPSDAIDNAIAVGGDTLDKAALLAAIPPTAPRTGLRALSETRLNRLRRDFETNLEAQRLAAVKEDQRLIAKADIDQSRLDSITGDIDARFSDPVRGLKETLAHEAGMVAGNGRSVTADPAGIRWFLFGPSPMAHLRRKALTALHTFLPEKDIQRLKAMDPESAEYAEAYKDLAVLWMGRISQITNNKWEPETYRAVFDNALNGGGEEGLLQIIATRVGLDINKGDISRGLKVIDTDGAKQFRTWRTSNSPVKKALARAMGERPNSREVNLENTGDVVDAIVKYGMYARIPADSINRYVGEVLFADMGMGSIETNVDVFKRLFTDIGTELTDRLAKSTTLFAGKKGDDRLGEMQSAIRESVALFLGGEQGYSNPRLAKFTPYTTVNKVVDENGREIILPDISIDSELLTGHIALPSVDQWDQAISRVGTAMHRIERVGSVYDFARRVYDNLFRTSLLVFRASYIIRNSAEMQIRMFLNGHHSVFSDPLTLAGMVVPGFSKKARAAIGDRFAPYSQTILDDAFEVGVDEELAIANHIEEYFALIRQSHSLTDPRVYANSVRSGWTQVGFKSPHFYKGWSNELIMLHRSEIARMVAGEIPPWARSMATGAPSQPDAVVDALLSGAEEAARLRARLIASNSEFEKVFASRQATKEYLFDAQGSVYNRIAAFTYNDPALVEFVRTGKFNDVTGSVNILTIPKLDDRIKDLSARLRAKYSKQDQEALADHFDGTRLGVPWNPRELDRKNSGLYDWFFDVANTIERIGSVGPEFRMAYWDKIAEIAPTLRRQDVDRALKAAETTLSPLKRRNPDGKLVDFGSNHPAWDALRKAKAENTDGMLSLDDIHGIAMDAASKHVRTLFYDAARRNNFWSAMRYIVPFGQAWGNTWKVWTQLGAQSPVQVYKVQKAFNAALDSGSSALYELGDTLGVYGDYAPGFAPWDQDASGGLLYSDQNGESSFMMPLVGRAAAIPVGMMAGLGLNGLQEIPMQSPAESMNLAGGIVPGVSFLGAFGLDALPDNDVIDGIMKAARPFGNDAAPGVLESLVPAWLAKVLGSVGSIPGIGAPAESMLGGLTPQNKNRYVRDAAVMLSASGSYDMTDPLETQRWKEDTKKLANTLLMTTGLLQNVMPTTPIPTPAVDLTADDMKGLKEQPNKGLYGLFMTNAMFPLYVQEAGGDQTVARQMFVSDYGAPFLFALTGTSRGGSRIPSSAALSWAKAHPEEARAYFDEFSMFFAEGDSSDVVAMRWLDRNGWDESMRKNPSEVIDENLTAFLQAQLKHIESLEARGFLSADEADEKRTKAKERFVGTQAGTYYGGMTRKQQLEKAHYAMTNVPSLAATQAGQAFSQAWRERELALEMARQRTGRDDAGLGSEAAMGIRQLYDERIGALIQQYPDFKVLGNIMLREWD